MGKYDWGSRFSTARFLDMYSCCSLFCFFWKPHIFPNWQFTKSTNVTKFNSTYMNAFEFLTCSLVSWLSNPIESYCEYFPPNQTKHWKSFSLTLRHHWTSMTGHHKVCGFSSDDVDGVPRKWQRRGVTERLHDRKCFADFGFVIAPNWQNGSLSDALYQA